MQQVDLSQYQNNLSRKNQLARFIWTLTWLLLARPLPRSVGSGWKRLLLRFLLQCTYIYALAFGNGRIQLFGPRSRLL